MSNTEQIVLLVDDDRFLLDMYATKFSQAGFKVELSSTGEDALAKLQSGLAPKAIIMDVVMPGVDGLELLSRIHAGNLCNDAALIVLSNQGQPSDIEKAKKLGIDGYIVKANTIPSEVLEQVKEIIANKKK